MAVELTFQQALYPGGRILLMLGQQEVGAIFPPAAHPQAALSPWRGCLWLGSFSQRPTAVLAKTEQAARNALLAEAREWLRKAGVE